jgi:hypothetical protein
VAALSAAIEHKPVWFAKTVTVAVEVPPEFVDVPTVHFPVGVEVKVTAPPDVALALIKKFCDELNEIRSDNVEKLMVFVSPTTALGSMYIVAPTHFPPV